MSGFDKKKCLRWVFIISALVSLTACSSTHSSSPTPSTSSGTPSDGGAAFGPTTHFGIVQASPVGTPISALGDNAILYFPFDTPRSGSHNYTPNHLDQERIDRVVEYLKSHPEESIIIEGHCDARGTSEYNMGLGARRATFFKRNLESLGINPNQISIVSYGKTHPSCAAHTETCWAKDRRAIIVRK